jgi:hypothetical protein
MSRFALNPLALPFIPDGVGDGNANVDDNSDHRIALQERIRQLQPRNLVGLFTHAYGKYCGQFEVTMMQILIGASSFATDILREIIKYITPEQLEFAQSALVQSRCGDEEFSDYLLEYDGCGDLELIRPWSTDGDPMTGEIFSTNSVVEIYELDDLPRLVTRIYHYMYDSLSKSELAEVIANLLEYRFAKLAEKPWVAAGTDCG